MLSRPYTARSSRRDADGPRKHGTQNSAMQKRMELTWQLADAIKRMSSQSDAVPHECVGRRGRRRRRAGRQPDLEAGAAAGLRMHLDAAADALDDLPHHRQAQAGAAL